MQFVTSKPVPYWSMIATALTNVGREEDSTEKTTSNLEIQEAMQGSKGWGIQFPAVLVKMADWPFLKSREVPHGCTAQEYIDAENNRRATLYATYVANNATADGRRILKAFEDIFCDSEKQLHKLTIKNAYWVHSGHQRTQYVFFDAYCLYLKRLENQALPGLTPEAIEGLPEVEGFSLTVPCVIGTYDPKNALVDICKDQMSANLSASKQFKLKILDCLKGAHLAIGQGITPAITERKFRDWFAAPTAKEGAKEGNAGALPRWAFLLGMINWYYGGSLDFMKKLFAVKTVAGADGKNVDNPDYINVNEVALMHDDPLCDAAVIARIMEPDLKKLKAYVSTYGSSERGGKKVLKEGDKDSVSELEYTIFERGSAWTVEEAKAWVRSKCKGAGKGVYHEPVIIKADPSTLPSAIITAVGQTITSDRTPNVVRAFNAKFTRIPVKAGTPIDEQADVKAQEIKGPLDAIWSLNGSQFEKMLLGCVEEACHLKDGNPAAFETVVSGFKKLLDAATTPPSVATATE